MGIQADVGGFRYSTYEGGEWNKVGRVKDQEADQKLGIDEALSNFNDNEMYNPLNDSRTVLEQMPTKRSGIEQLFLLLIVTSMYLEVRTLTVLSAILKNIIQK